MGPPWEHEGRTTWVVASIAFPKTWQMVHAALAGRFFCCCLRFLLQLWWAKSLRLSLLLSLLLGSSACGALSLLRALAVCTCCILT